VIVKHLISILRITPASPEADPFLPPSQQLWLGDMHDVARSLVMQTGEREAAGLPVTFDRIFVSNVPDFTTLLPTFTMLLPLLKPGRGLLRHSVLLGTPLYSDLAQ
jgi:hypothetical protein